MILEGHHATHTTAMGTRMHCPPFRYKMLDAVTPVELLHLPSAIEQLILRTCQHSPNGFARTDLKHAYQIGVTMRRQAHSQMEGETWPDEKAVFAGQWAVITIGRSFLWTQDAQAMQGSLSEAVSGMAIFENEAMVMACCSGLCVQWLPNHAGRFTLNSLQEDVAAWLTSVPSGVMKGCCLLMPMIAPDFSMLGSSTGCDLHIPEEPRNIVASYLAPGTGRRQQVSSPSARKQTKSSKPPTLS